MIEWPEHSKRVYPHEDSFSRRFAKKYYEISISRTYDQLPELNYHCDKFVIGSDQLWNYWSTKENGAFFFLDFVEDSKKKIAYATSFGHSPYEAPAHALKEASFHMNRLDAISIREDEGVEICKNIFGVEAQRVIDPVFFLNEAHYDKLTGDAKVKETDKFFFAYILSPSQEKRSLLMQIEEMTGIKVILVLDAQSPNDDDKKIMNMPEAVKENIELEDWLYYIKNAEFIITDSYHGLCFSLIFQKKFACIANIKRGLSRFKTLMDITGIEENIVFDVEEILRKQIYLKKVNYDYVWKKLNGEIQKSQKWLLQAIEKEKICRPSTYDMLMQKILKLEEKVK